jgi:hypothetical protein
VDEANDIGDSPDSSTDMFGPDGTKGHGIIRGTPALGSGPGVGVRSLGSSKDTLGIGLAGAGWYSIGSPDIGPSNVGGSAVGCDHAIKSWNDGNVGRTGTAVAAGFGSDTDADARVSDRPDVGKGE